MKGGVQSHFTFFCLKITDFELKIYFNIDMFH